MAVSDHANWPGERDDPSHRDVASANERPDPALLSHFREALMSSQDAASSEPLLKTSLNDRMTAPTPSSAIYTYPLALLSRFPDLPSPERLEALCQSFSVSCKEHVFLDNFPVSPSTRESLAPLRYGFACLASLCSPESPPDEPSRLFLAGASLWPVMIEIDNSLSRSVEILIASILLTPCGVLSTSEVARTRATLLLAGTLTVARRMRLHHPEQLDPTLRQRIVSYSPMIWTLWLWDVIQAIHSGLPLDFFTGEMLSTLPSSTIPFQTIYQDMLQEAHDHDPVLYACANQNSRDQAVLLLVAILTDAITVRRSLSGSSKTASLSQVAAYAHNPFVPFCAQTELERMERQLSMALFRWNNKFGKSMSPDIMAFYLFVKMFLASTALPTLQYIVRNQPDSQHACEELKSSLTEDMSDSAVDCAWAILDAAASAGRPSTSLCSAWMPIVTFHAALVAWAKIVMAKPGGRGGQGSVRALLAFKVELTKMQWPCCVEMVDILDMLMTV